MSQEYSVVEKISPSGYQRTFVPRSVHDPMTSSGEVVTPRSKRMRWILPSRRTSTSIHSLSALTQLTPTPCRPPETL